MSSSSPASQFGPNEWLVEEMYEQFLADPSSVDSAWHDFFADYKPTQRASQTAAADRTGENRFSGENHTTDTRPSQPREARLRAGRGDVGRPTTARPAGQAQAPKAGHRSADRHKPAPAKKPKPEAKPAAKPAPPKTGDKSEKGEEAKPLRGAAAVIAKNMDLSLTIPTATSVRAVPAKLLFDNRIVINNHLRRTRGGKVSFTHLIGYALVRALADYPNMNRHYGESTASRPRDAGARQPRAGDRPARARTAAAPSWWRRSRTARA